MESVRKTLQVDRFDESHIFRPGLGRFRRGWIAGWGTAATVRPWAVMAPAVSAPPLWFCATVGFSPWLGGAVAGVCIAVSLRFAVPLWRRDAISIDSFARGSRRILEDALLDAEATLAAAGRSKGAIAEGDIFDALERELWRLALGLRRLDGMSTGPARSDLQRRVAAQASRIVKLRDATQRLAYTVEDRWSMTANQGMAEPSTLEVLTGEVDSLTHGFLLLQKRV